MRDPTLEELAAVLDNAKVRNGELRAACPAHGGEDQNLSLTYRDGKLLGTCHSHHCPFSEIMAAIRERMGYEETNGRVVNITHGKKSKKKRVKSRQEWDVEGVARHVRTEYEDGTKDFSWRMPDGTWKLVGMGTSDIPLYGTSEALRKPDASVVVVEGEKAADALREADICAVGTVTGAKGTPGEAALAPFRGRTMILWPDNDEPGHIHMGKVAQGLDAIGADVRWFEWAEAEDKGDAADHPAIVGSEDKASLIAQLEEAKRWSKPPPIEGRALLGSAMRSGIDPPEELLRDMLLAGKAHNIYAPGGVGKTWLLVWIANELARQGSKVVVFDLENGLRTYAERFEEMGADPDTLDRLVHYYPFPVLKPENYEAMLEEEKPDVVLFDSWIGFLSSEGLEESENKDIATWASRYFKPALRRGSAIVVLDHVPHDQERERGASRKRDEVDVAWKLTKVGDFDRDQTAALVMTRMKDREGWLPERLTFEIGGSDEGFVMRRDDRLAREVDVTMLSGDEKAVLGILEELRGARASQWQKASENEIEMPKRKFYRVKKSLEEKGKILAEDGVFRSLRTTLNTNKQPSTNTQGADGAELVQDTSAPSRESVGAEPSGAPPLEGGAPRGSSAPSAPAPKNVPFTEVGADEKKRLFEERLKLARERRQRGE